MMEIQIVSDYYCLERQIGHTETQEALRRIHPACLCYQTALIQSHRTKFPDYLRLSSEAGVVLSYDVMNVCKRPCPVEP